MKNAIIYARYSSERQTEQSIEGQLSVCNEYAERNGLTIVDTYIDSYDGNERSTSRIPANASRLRQTRTVGYCIGLRHRQIWAKLYRNRSQ